MSPHAQLDHRTRWLALIVLCCGNLMIVLLAVGLMNLPWMVLITLVIFIEKVWHDASRLNPLIGMALVAYGVLSFINPALLSGLYVQ